MKHTGALCLHCVIWDTIRDHVARSGSCLGGRAICDRDLLIEMLGNVLADVFYSNPDVPDRIASAAWFADELVATVSMPGTVQPRPDVEVVSWQ